MRGWTIGMLAALCAGGCVVDGGGEARGCDPGFVAEGGVCVEATAQFDVAWDPDPDCPEGATTTQVISVDSSGLEYYDIYWCDDFAGVTGPLPLGSYDVYVNLTDTEELELFAQSFATQAELAALDETLPLDFVFIADRGFFSAGWSVSGGCEAAGIVTVELVADQDVLASAPCADMALETSPLTLGPRDVHLRAVEGDGSTIVATGAVWSTELEFGNQLVELGQVDF